MTTQPNSPQQELEAAIASMTATPYEIAWLYARAAFDLYGRNHSLTSRTLGIHRRTLQRTLKSKRPARASEERN